MLYPNDIEQKLGFDKIRALLQNHCSGERGKDNVDKIRFSSNKPLLLKLCRQSGEFMKLYQAGESIPSLHYPKIDESLAKLNVIGVFLETDEIVDISKTLRILVDWIGFLHNRQEQYPELATLSQHVDIDPMLIKKIEACIDEKGEIKSSASPELRKIRTEIQKNEGIARKTLDRVMRETRKSDMSPEDSSLTIRNGRLVMPVKSEYKRSVKGFIHDASSSGNIIFIEPAEVLEINNDLKELSYSEKREIIRILTRLSDELRAYVPAISHGDKFLGIVDLIKAKALLSLDFDALVPELNTRHAFNWKAAVNPILKKALVKQGKTLVPLDVRLDEQNRVLLISGPNAGGKSVCLKTVGLLHYMYQCGIPVSLREGSTVTIFNNIFIDIGDEQSIEDDLSTYSSHLKAMDFFIKHTDKNTLFLIDEFGSGTDPQFGGAIAEAILEQLTTSKGMGIITTHYNNLK
ncbi:MAG: endonuclease MutS2, partial [Cyclobacteriaceae bacterium]|nr:endonuclease MutS2 [Cyclobacteriaceae bacterium]